MDGSPNAKEQQQKPSDEVSVDKNPNGVAATDELSLANLYRQVKDLTRPRKIEYHEMDGLCSIELCDLARRASPLVSLLGVLLLLWLRSFRFPVLPFFSNVNKPWLYRIPSALYSLTTYHTDIAAIL
jgi:hypothetical protein